MTPATTPEEGRFLPGTILAQRYRIAGRLGKGGMGEVYRATDMLVGQPVALKFLPEELAGSDAALDRLRSEVRLSRQISHPNVCRVYDLGDAGGQVFLTMEFIDGEDLASLLRRIGRLPSAKAIEVARRLCAGLAAAHEKNVLHRDLKPGNIMIDGRGQVLITDFGLAGVASEIRQGDVQSGTPAYMSPEQLTGVEVTQRSDIYSLGLVLYELFAGNPPHAALSRGELTRLRQSAPPLLADSVPDVEPAVERIVTRCLAPDPAKRPASALAVAAALPGGDLLAAALAQGETPSPELVAAADPTETMRPRVAVACLFGLALLMTVSAWLIGSVSVYSPVAGIEPVVMAQSARDILSGLGYMPQPSWSEWAYTFDLHKFDGVIRLNGAAARRRVAEDSPAYFWYRYSPEPMVAMQDPFNPFVLQSDPPLTVPGMLLVQLDSKRRLLLFRAVLPEREDANRKPPFEWTRLFAAAGLDAARFSSVAPLWTPPSAFDARSAWLENNSNDPLRVEAAAWQGLPVYFRVAHISGTVARAQVEPAEVPFLIYNSLVLAIMAVLVWLNVRKRRGDLRGAARFGLFIAATVLLYQLLGTNYTANRGWITLVAVIGNALWAGAYSACGYLAFEPFVRRKWPHALISWTRLLAGRLGDPLVGQHLLIGLLFGAVVTSVVGLLEQQVFGFSIPYWHSVADSPIRLAQSVLGALPQTAIDTAAMVCLLFAAVTVCRIGWVGACLTAVILTPLLIINAPHLTWTLPVSLLLYTAAMLFALRFGVLALGAAVFVKQLAATAPLTLDRSAFYFGPSLAVLALIIGLGAYGCRNAIAGQRRPKSGGHR